MANAVVDSSISLEGLTPAFTLSGIPGAEVEAADAVAYRVVTNSAGGYVVDVVAARDALVPTGGSPDSIPIEDLLVRPGGSGSAYAPMSATDAHRLHAKTSRSAAAGDSYTDDYAMRIPDVTSDTYSVELTYIATAV